MGTTLWSSFFVFIFIAQYCMEGYNISLIVLKKIITCCMCVIDELTLEVLGKHRPPPPSLIHGVVNLFLGSVDN